MASLSVVMAHRLNCSVACGIFLNQGSNLCLLYQQADSFTTEPTGEPRNKSLSFESQSWERRDACMCGCEEEHASALLWALDGCVLSLRWFNVLGELLRSL